MGPGSRPASDGGQESGPIRKKALRPIARPFVVAGARGTQVRTRLFLAKNDEAVVLAIGRHLGSLASRDLAERLRGGVSNADRRDRKRALTAASSSRWAGAITRTSNDQWLVARRNLERRAHQMHAVTARIRERLTAPCGDRDANGLRGYATRDERYQKQRRLQILENQLIRIEARLQSGRVSVCRGGVVLARNRHNLEAVGVSAEVWRSRWNAERMFITADGEADKRLGNETIRWDPETQKLEIRLPTPLLQLANAPAGRYRLSRVTFPYRAESVAAQISLGAVRYDISFEPVRRRWYLTASWTFERQTPSLEQARSRGMLGVDLNADHLAVWALDRYGNPLGDPRTIPLELRGLPATQRDGRLRAAASALIRAVRARGLSAIAIEDLDFEPDKALSREACGRGGRGRRFRRMLHGLSTSRFRSRLLQMSSNASVPVVAVDPAYTSVWGAQQWQRPLGVERHGVVSVHHSAAVVIGRRGLGFGARRRRGVTERQRSHAAGRATFQAGPRVLGREESRTDRGSREDPSSPTLNMRRTRAPMTARGAPGEREPRSLRRNGGRVDEFTLSPRMP